MDDTPILNEKYVIAGAVFLVFAIYIVLACYIYANKSEPEKGTINHHVSTNNTSEPVDRFNSIVNENEDHKVHIVKLKFDRINSNDKPDAIQPQLQTEKNTDNISR